VTGLEGEAPSEPEFSRGKREIGWECEALPELPSSRGSVGASPWRVEKLRFSRLHIHFIDEEAHECDAAELSPEHDSLKRSRPNDRTY